MQNNFYPCKTTQNTLEFLIFFFFIVNRIFAMKRRIWHHKTGSEPPKFFSGKSVRFVICNFVQYYFFTFFCGNFNCSWTEVESQTLCMKAQNILLTRQPNKWRGRELVKNPLSKETIHRKFYISRNYHIWFVFCFLRTLSRKNEGPRTNSRD